LAPAFTKYGADDEIPRLAISLMVADWPEWLYCGALALLVKRRFVPQSVADYQKKVGIKGGVFEAVIPFTILNTRLSCQYIL
jgi:hypothetical protein